jgi:hypothetical protein
MPHALAVAAAGYASKPGPRIIQETRRDSGRRNLLRMTLFMRAAASKKRLNLS